MVVQGSAQEATGGLDRRRYVFVNEWLRDKLHNVGEDRCGKYFYKFEYRGRRQTNVYVNAIPRLRDTKLLH